MKIAFFETEIWEGTYLKEKLASHELDFYGGRLNKKSIPEKTDYDIVSVFANSEVGSEVLGAFPNLKFIATRTTGYDHIDLTGAENRKIVVSNVPSYGENSVAEFAFGLLLNLSRKIFAAYNRIRETASFDLNGLRGIDLKGKTIGVVGTGRIGRHMIKMAKGFEMNVVATDAYPDEKFAADNQIKYVTFEELLGQSDVITFHVPELPSTFHMLNMGNIGLVKRGALVINTARGSIIETAALVKALHEGIIGGAGLDVLEEEISTKEVREFIMSGEGKTHNLETILYNHLLVDMDNVIITPHNAFNSEEGVMRIMNTTVENIDSFVAGTPQNEVKAK
ncbi:MAG: NAD(P)-dependent oxidoreductase [Parcubacteria group bacterium]